MWAGSARLRSDDNGTLDADTPQQLTAGGREVDDLVLRIELVERVERFREQRHSRCHGSTGLFT